MTTAYADTIGTAEHPYDTPRIHVPPANPGLCHRSIGLDGPAPGSADSLSH